MLFQQDGELPRFKTMWKASYMPRAKGNGLPGSLCRQNTYLESDGGTDQL